MNFRVGYALSVAVISILIFIIGLLWTYDRHQISEVEESTIDYRRDMMEGGEYLRFVFVGSYGCGFSNNEDTHHMVRELNHHLRAFAEEWDVGYLATGISWDEYASHGIRFLDETGPYDEMLAGAGAYNLGVHHYVWSDHPGPSSTPQVLVLRTGFNLIPVGRMGVRDINRTDELLERADGMRAIEELYELVTDSSPGDLADALGL